MKRTSLFLTVTLTLIGLVAATGSAHADEFVQITGPATAVEVGTEFTYTVNVPPPHGENLGFLFAKLNGAAATFTSAVDNGPHLNCHPLDSTQISCLSPIIGLPGPGPVGFNFQWTLKVLPHEAGIVSLQVEVASRNGTFTGSDTKPTTIIDPLVADLDVTLDASSSILLLSRIVYTAHAFNNGPDTSPGSTVTTHLSSPAVSVNAGSGCSLASGNHDVTCPVGSLASGSGANATFTVTFPLLTIGLPLNATATIAGTGPTDPTPGNNTDSAACIAVTSALIVCH